MARGKKTGGRNFPVGNKFGNGRPEVPKDVKVMRQLTRAEFERLANEMITMDYEQLKAKLKEPGTTMLEHMVGSIVTKGIKEGDQQRLNFLLDRLIGKVVDKQEILIHKREIIAKMGKDELIAVTEKLLNKMKHDQDDPKEPGLLQAPSPVVSDPEGDGI